jgi:hypothetical protein
MGKESGEFPEALNREWHMPDGVPQYQPNRSEQPAAIFGESVGQVDDHTAYAGRMTGYCKLTK